MYHFQRVSSYVNTESVGNVEVKIKQADCKDRHVLVVEDIYDTGKSMAEILKTIKELGALSVKTCILLHKKNPSNLEINYWGDYLGFFIPRKFVIGYGMDYNEYFRDMQHLCSIAPSAIEKYK
jgi:hypoxanthine phosphoribosyltransferase